MLLTQTTYNAPETGYEFGLKLINKLSTDSDAFNFECDKYVDEYDNLLVFVFDDFKWIKKDFDIELY